MGVCQASLWRLDGFRPLALSRYPFSVSPEWPRTTSWNSGRGEQCPSKTGSFIVAQQRWTAQCLQDLESPMHHQPQRRHQPVSCAYPAKEPAQWLARPSTFIDTAWRRPANTKQFVSSVQMFNGQVRSFRRGMSRMTHFTLQ